MRKEVISLTKGGIRISVTVDIHGKAYAKAVGEIPTALQLLVDKYQKSSVKPTAIMAELTKAIKE